MRDMRRRRKLPSSGIARRMLLVTGRSDRLVANEKSRAGDRLADFLVLGIRGQETAPTRFKENPDDH